MPHPGSPARGPRGRPPGDAAGWVFWLIADGGVWFHGCSGHRRTLPWGRAAWRADGRWPARSVAYGAAGAPGTVAPCRGAGLLCVPVGGGPPASRPRRELRSARRLEARPGPATAHRHRNLVPPAPSTPAAPDVLIRLAPHPDTPPSPATAHRHRSQAPHDFWYCYAAPRIFQAPPAPSTPAVLGMPTYGLAHRLAGASDRAHIHAFTCYR